MAEQLAQAKAEFTMYYCSRSQSRTAFIDRIQSSNYSQNVNLYFDDANDGVKLNVREALSDYSEGDHLYVCGPTGFMDFILAEARNAGWPEKSLHREYFAAKLESQSNNRGFEIQLASSGRCLTIPEDKSVAEVLLEEGIELPMSCEQGVCGTCLTRVLEGVPDHRDSVLTTAERARNDQFTPCCSRAISQRLVLEL
ncbi:flavin reductase family protein [Marinobacterium lacunae]|uniref:flavin reductase family protein n=1 Tax=Marinobacterium lacunae TaxID=1232683 RepID=UPI001E493FB6|nr:iron-sulfur cluster-binding domain-containing protein [Marinobacterium lacunae]